MKKYPKINRVPYYIKAQLDNSCTSFFGEYYHLAANNKSV